MRIRVFKDPETPEEWFKLAHTDEIEARKAFMEER